MAGPLVLFDLNGTLLDPAGLTSPWGPGHRDLALRALEEAVSTSMADTLAGVFRPFAELLEPALARQAALAGLDPSRAADGAAAATELAPFAEARGALHTLADAGLRLAVLTNSGREQGLEAVANAGLSDLIDDVRGTDEVQRYKPHPEVYAHALEALGAQADSSWLVAAHGWDVGGAARAGLRTCWISRDERRLNASIPPPDLCAADLAEAARLLVGAV